MNRVPAKSSDKAFNLIELLAVLAIIGLIAATFLQPKKALPVDSPQRDRVRDGGGSASRCAFNQKTIAEAFSKAARDRDDQSLWVPSPDAREPVGTGHVASQFQMLSNYIQDVSVLLCPSDRTRWLARDFATLEDTNVSYFMNVDARKGPNAATTILFGDRHLEVGTNAVAPGLFVYTKGMEMGWTTELHTRMRFGNTNGMGMGWQRRTNGMEMRWRTNMNPNFPMGPAGTMAFVDGHVERFPTAATNLSAIFARQNLESARLLVP